MTAKLSRAMLVAALLVAVPSVAAGKIPVQVGGASADEVQEQSDGGALHRDSGLRFPKSAGAMQIGKLSVYGDSDVSAIYYLSDKATDPWLSFYIYPVGQPIDAEEQTVRQSIEQNWTAKTMTAPVAIDLPADIRTGWYDVRNQQVAGRSVYAVVRRGDWYLKARLTIPHEAGDAGIAAASAALRDLPWAGTGALPRSSAPTQIGQD